jgi:hypothetical protein
MRVVVAMVMAMPVAVFVVVHFLVFYVDPFFPVSSLLVLLLDG